MPIPKRWSKFILRNIRRISEAQGVCELADVKHEIVFIGCSDKKRDLRSILADNRIHMPKSVKYFRVEKCTNPKNAESLQLRHFEKFVERYHRSPRFQHYAETQAVYLKKYDKVLRSHGEYVDRHLRSHPIPKHLYPYFVEPHQKIPTEKVRYLDRIIKEADSEDPIHKFLEENPLFLTRKIWPGHHGLFCVSKPALSNELVPDFFMAGLNSAGMWWFGVELESPTKPMFNVSGAPSKELTHALRQVRDWRSWLRDNKDQANRVERGLGFFDIDRDLRCIILIGRRGNEPLGEAELNIMRRDVIQNDKYGLIIHHYEWLLEV